MKEVVKLRTVGKALVMGVPKRICEELRLKEGQFVEVKTANGCLIVKREGAK